MNPWKNQEANQQTYLQSFMWSPITRIRPLVINSVFFWWVSCNYDCVAVIWRSVDGSARIRTSRVTSRTLQLCNVVLQLRENRFVLVLSTCDDAISWRDSFHQCDCFILPSALLRFLDTVRFWTILNIFKHWAFYKFSPYWIDVEITTVSANGFKFGIMHFLKLSLFPWKR